VIRTRVTRRLRHLVAPHLADLPAGMGLVVRALPAAADATTEDLARDLAAGLRRCVRGVVGHQHVTPGVMSQ
jgi:ribonuclease P protein component